MPHNRNRVTRVPGKGCIDIDHNGDPALRLTDRALSPRTRYAYRHALRRLNDWLGNEPLGDATLARYIDILFERGNARSTAAVTVAAACSQAARDNAVSPRGPLTNAALTAFRRDGAGRGPGQVMGIRWEQADLMADLAEARRVAVGLRDALFVRLASDCLLRVGEAAALNVRDISFAEDGLRVLLRRSKTDQEGRGSVLYAGPPTARLARLWLKTARISEGPLFRPVNKAGVVGDGRLTERSMREIVKRWAAAAGIEGRVSGHSFRVGAAQSLRDAGATVPELMSVGRWKRIETMARYTREQDAAVGPVARLRYGVAWPDGRALQAPRQNRRLANVAQRKTEEK